MCCHFLGLLVAGAVKIGEKVGGGRRRVPARRQYINSLKFHRSMNGAINKEEEDEMECTSFQVQTEERCRLI